MKESKCIIVLHILDSTIQCMTSFYVGYCVIKFRPKDSFSYQSIFLFFYFNFVLWRISRWYVHFAFRRLYIGQYDFLRLGVFWCLLNFWTCYIKVKLAIFSYRQKYAKENDENELSMGTKNNLKVRKKYLKKNI